MSKLILRSFQSPGDILMLTAAVRDLHAAYPGQFTTDVRTSADDLWLNNPRISRLNEHEADVSVIDMHYPLIHQSDQRPYHFLHGYVQYLEQQLGLSIPVTRFQGDLHLSNDEKESPLPWSEIKSPYWIVMAGGKFDFTAKWWNPEYYQEVVNHFEGRLQFVQCGQADHWHPPLNNVVNLIGKTDIRQFLKLIYHADGILSPVTFAMHAAAAVETPPGKPKNRACVVIAGGREPPHWEAYPHHRFLSTNGALTCCSNGGCWKSRCQKVGDGDDKDRRNLCEQPVEVNERLSIPRCMYLIQPREVIHNIELYYEGGALSYQNQSVSQRLFRQNGTPSILSASRQRKQQKVLIEFRHGLGDAAQFTSVLKHLKKFYPHWIVDVSALVGKHTCYQGLCRQIFRLRDEHVDPSEYDKRYILDWDECRHDHEFWPSTKVARCLLEIFRLTPRPEMCSYSIQTGKQAQAAAANYLSEITGVTANEEGRFPAVLIHYEGNTSGSKKNLPHTLIQQVCEDIIETGFVPVILDWDQRSPLIDGRRILNPDARHSLWQGKGTGDAETLAALIEASSLMIGIDSGPLHVAGATTTPTIGVWTHHHPIHFFDLADHVQHLVPRNHAENAAGPHCLKFFEENYRHQVYDQLDLELRSMVLSQLSGSDEIHTPENLANRDFLKQLTSTAYNKTYYDEHKEAGLDYLGFGDWQIHYGRWLVDALAWADRKVLDVGCACGSIVRGLGIAGAVVQGVDVNEFMIQQGRQQWPDMVPLLHICDAVNLHLFGDQSWDAIHSAQVAEHWKPELVPFILKELHRVTADNGMFLCFLDTEELMARQGRNAVDEDPTHICIRPLEWWHTQLKNAGWEVCTDEYSSKIEQAKGSYLQKYDWDWFLARKVAS